MRPVLVTGATGTVGQHVVRRLRARDVPVRALVRDRAAGTALGPDVELAVGDFGDPSSLHGALAGVDRVFLACGNHPRQVAWESAVVDAAVEAGVRLVVKLSALGADPESPVAFANAHARIEQHLRCSGVGSVVLRPAYYMSNLLGAAASVRHARAVFLPADGAKVAMVDPRDVAEVAAVVLATDGHDGHSYELTGPDAVTFDTVAEALTDVSGQPVRFVPLSDEAALEQLLCLGAGEWVAANTVRQFAMLRAGAQAEAGDAVRVLTGREPRSVAEFLGDHAALFRRDAAG